MSARIVVIISLLATLAWVILCLLTFAPSMFLGQQLFDPADLTVVVIALAPILVIWALTLPNLAAARNADKISTLRSQIQVLQNRVADNELKWEPAEGPGDAPVLVDAGSRGGPQPTAKPVEVTEPVPDTETAAVPRHILIRAMNFAEDADDREAFEALDMAAKDPEMEEFLELSMDILQLLATANLVVDGFVTDYAPPETWRRAFSNGTSAPLAQLGGIGELDDLTICGGLLARDAKAKETARRFVARAKEVIHRIVDGASDGEILSLADSRTVRACLFVDTALREY